MPPVAGPRYRSRVPLEELAWMALAELAGGESRAFAELAAVLGSARAVFDASVAELGRLGMNEAGVRAVLRFDAWDGLRARRERCTELGISIAAFDSAGYPAQLRHIADPPLILYYRGGAPGSFGPVVAVVGSRRATRYGLRVAEALGERLARRGVVVVSGLARGIDAAAHVGAVRGGVSIAVLAGGLDRVYPARNRRLCERLAVAGSVVSESAPGTPLRPYLFPVRNRIITGMSAATVIVEAGERSGSLVSARLAAEQGREVFAVPGNIDSPTSAGANALIRDGAVPLLAPAQVLEVCGIEAAVAPEDAAGGGECSSDKPFDGNASTAVVAALDPSGSHLDDVAEAVGLDGARVMELLTSLELGGFVERLPGGRFAPSAALFEQGAPRTYDGNDETEGGRRGHGD
ncbi:MAG: DNA-processing protein DprA [Candidatus Binatia bacterium]